MKRLIFIIVGTVVAFGTLVLSAQTSGLEYRYFDSGGVKIAFTEKGHGEPIILLHAAMADTEFNWMQFGVLNALAENYRVISLDFRGHGRSDKPHDPKAYGRCLTRDVVALMDHLKISKAHLLGYSMGSHVAMTLVADHPGRIISAALGGPTWIRPGGKFDPPNEEDFLKMNAAVFGGRNDVKAVLMCIESMADWAVTEEQLRAAHVPCLFLFGTKDDNIKKIPDLKKAMAEYAEFVEIEGAGHGDALLKPEFMKAVVRFLGDHAVSQRRRT
jgi:pimeloyl-ACP methyl ester carboxylesterase